jgi:hypothetical protein
MLIPLLVQNLGPPAPPPPAIVFPTPPTHRSGGVWTIYKVGCFFRMDSPWSSKGIDAVNPQQLIEEAKRAGASKIVIED